MGEQETGRTLRDIADNMIVAALSTDPKAALPAACQIRDTLEGKPAQAVTGADGKDLFPDRREMSEFEVARRIAFALRTALEKGETQEGVVQEGEDPW